VLNRRDEAFLPGPLYPFPYLDPAAAGTDGCPGSALAGISADLAPQADLNAGAARAALRKAVLAARNGDPR
jgi:hypothetical protein